MSERPDAGGLRGWALALVVLVPRLVVFPWNENLAGDAIVRTWLAHYWLAAPHVIGSFDQGSLQFGPLHVYLLALFELVVPALEHSGRVLSLLVGAATAVPLFSLTRRLFGRPAASWAVVSFALWGLHVQASTTAASEALNLLLVMSAIALLQAWRDQGRRVLLLATALVLNLACATRYDSWLLVPMVAAVVWWHSRRWQPAAWLGVASSAFAIAWMGGNWLDRGNPLFPFVFIDAFHRAWFPSEAARWGAWGYRLICLGFWPGAAAVTLTPLVAVAGFLGLRRAWRERKDTRWLVLFVVGPAVLYTARALLFSSFAPLVRFTMKEVLLLLPFVWFGAQPVLARLSPRGARALVRVALGVAVAWPAWLGWYCFRTDGTGPDTLRALAPTSTNAPRLMRVARWLKENGAAGMDGVLVDRDPRDYDDLNIAFFAGFPYERLVRRRSVIFEQRVASNRIGFVVRFEGGRLEEEGRLHVSDGAVSFDGQRFVEVPGFERPVHVYRRAP